MTNILRRLFKARKPSDGTTYALGQTVSCEKCGRSVTIDSPRKDSKGKILLSSVEQMMPFAFCCRHCDFITCAECALLAYELHNPRQGIPTCPGCGKVATMFFTEWLSLKEKK